MTTSTTAAPIVDAYLSFRSPYSYLALTRMKKMEAAGEVRWNVKFVTPLAIRLPSYFERNAPLQRVMVQAESGEVTRTSPPRSYWPVPRL